MKVYIILAIVALAAAQETSYVTQEYVSRVKSSASFEVQNYADHVFKDFTLQEIRCKLGLLKNTKPRTITYGEVNPSLPKNFDAREQWKNCIHPIRDQKHCGSCWAFAASEVLSDRFCIASQGQVDVVLSPQDLVSCDKNDFGCQGGYIDQSWEYLTHTGIVTDECLPYSSGSGDSGKCPFSKKKQECVKGEFKKYKSSSYKQFETIQEIKEEIVTNGPVEAGFTVYDDFLSYKSGVYKRTSNNVLGGHAVKIVGFGVEDGVENGDEYWIVANSWGPKWGEDGFFRIKIGECDFESEIHAGVPELDSRNNLFME